MTTTVFLEKDMYKKSRLALRKRYPEKDGWNLISQDNRKTGYRPDFVIERKNEPFFGKDHYQKIVVEVKAEKIIKLSHIKQLTGYAKKHAGGQSLIEKKILIIPSGSDLTQVENLIKKFDIEVIRLKSFYRE